MLVLSQYHILESYKTNIYRVQHSTVLLHLLSNHVVFSLPSRPEELIKTLPNS